ncbi:hypothetical protein PIB30_038058 [Stylosanthes scabra]|uniref:RNase H type-1 domain-containing protein n=1 Tax=Stylosanthes scabra TaxID=79078 RepID=A0ABU6WDL2_9FABA|nr:hypothetical protein [Stylosanthes scabra]
MHYFQDELVRSKNSLGKDNMKRWCSIAFLLWSTCKTRNNNVFLSFQPDPTATIFTAKLIESEYSNPHHKITHPIQTTETKWNHPITWRPPPSNWLKINVDATFYSKSGKGAIATVIRDSEEALQGGSTYEIRIGTSLTVESIALQSIIIAPLKLLLRTPIGWVPQHQPISKDSKSLVESVVESSKVNAP